MTGKSLKNRKELPDLTFRGLTTKEKIGFFYFCGLAVGLGTLGLSVVLVVFDLLTGSPIRIGSILGASLFVSLAANWWFLPLPLPFWLEKEGSVKGAASMILPILFFVLIAFVFLAFS